VWPEVVKRFDHLGQNAVRDARSRSGEEPGSAARRSGERVNR
jgi:hypothetical protein